MRSPYAWGRTSNVRWTRNRQPRLGKMESIIRLVREISKEWSLSAQDEPKRWIRRVIWISRTTEFFSERIDCRWTFLWKPVRFSESGPCPVSIAWGKSSSKGEQQSFEARTSWSVHETLFSAAYGVQASLNWNRERKWLLLVWKMRFDRNRDRNSMHFASGVRVVQHFPLPLPSGSPCLWPHCNCSWLYRPATSSVFEILSYVPGTRVQYTSWISDILTSMQNYRSTIHMTSKNENEAMNQYLNSLSRSLPSKPIEPVPGTWRIEHEVRHSIFSVVVQRKLFSCSSIDFSPDY